MAACAFVVSLKMCVCFFFVEIFVGSCVCIFVLSTSFLSLSISLYLVHFRLYLTILFFFSSWVFPRYSMLSMVWWSFVSFHQDKINSWLFWINAYSTAGTHIDSFIMACQTILDECAQKLHKAVIKIDLCPIFNTWNTNKI